MPVADDKPCAARTGFAKIELNATPSIDASGDAASWSLNLHKRSQKKACPRLIVDASRTGALMSGPPIARIEKQLKPAPFLTKGATPDVRAAKLYQNVLTAKNLDPLGRAVALPFDGSGRDGWIPANQQECLTEWLLES